MMKRRFGFWLAAIFSITVVNRAPSLALPQNAAADAQSGRARELLSAQRELTAVDIALIQSAVRAALGGKYVVGRVIARSQPDENREDEYLLDEQGRLLFHRYPVDDTARPGTTRDTILEFTRIPAVRCADRSAMPGHRLGFTYYEDGKGWHLGNPMVVDDEGAPWATGSPGYDALHTPAVNLRDLGVSRMDGRAVRGLRISGALAEKTVWIDVASLLPSVETVAMTVEGKRAEVRSVWSYPPPRPIGRPNGVTIPDCA